MLHLDADRLAALADELPTVPEAEHLAACAACAREVDAYGGLRAAGARSGGVPLDAPLTTWASLAPALREAGVMTADDADDRGSLRRWFRPWMGAAAAVVLAAGGAAAGRLTAPRAGAGAGTSPIAATSAPPSGVRNASIKTSEGTAFVSVDDALKVMERAEHDYRAAAAFIAAHDTSSRDDADRYRLRLAALGKVQDAVREAVRTSPDDPVLNQYLLSTRSARAVTLQQLGKTLPNGVRLASY